MADLSINFAGIKAPNPFWLASAPPTDKAYNVVRAYEAGWGGVVWKTLGEDPAAVNVSSRYSAHFGPNREVMGINNIELITDRSLEINLREITQVKKDWPDRALIVSLMVPCEEQAWKYILPLVEATGADGIELNFGCPHGMPEGAAQEAVTADTDIPLDVEIPSISADVEASVPLDSETKDIHMTDGPSDQPPVCFTAQHSATQHSFPFLI